MRISKLDRSSSISCRNSSEKSQQAWVKRHQSKTFYLYQREMEWVKENPSLQVKGGFLLLYEDPILARDDSGLDLRYHEIGRNVKACIYLPPHRYAPYLYTFASLVTPEALFVRYHAKAVGLVSSRMVEEMRKIFLGESSLESFSCESILHFHKEATV